MLNRLRYWWWHKKYEWLCNHGFHVTYDMKYKHKQVNLAKEGRPLRLSYGVGPVMRMHCSRCEKRVNTAIPDEYFYGDKGVLK